MTIWEYINKHHKTTRHLADAGLIKAKVSLYFGIYGRYLFYIKRGNSKTRAIRLACADYNTCEQTGWNAVKTMEQNL